MALYKLHLSSFPFMRLEREKMNNNGDHLNEATTLRKVFVGGLAWGTPLETMKAHFDKYGHILEAVIISDKLTGRSKGYGFVTFKDAESARKACEDPAPVINGRRANCNIASLGAARRTKPPPTPPGARAASMPPPINYLQWYYPTAAPPQAAAAPGFYHRCHPHHRQPFPFYGYPLDYTGGVHYNGHYPTLYPVVGANMLAPVQQFYQFQRPPLGLPTHMYSYTATSPISTDPALLSKPKSVSPAAAVGC